MQRGASKSLEKSESGASKSLEKSGSVASKSLKKSESVQNLESPVWCCCWTQDNFYFTKTDCWRFKKTSSKSTRSTWHCNCKAMVCFDAFAVFRFIFLVMELLLVWILNNDGKIRKRTTCEFCLMNGIKFNTECVCV